RHWLLRARCCSNLRPGGARPYADLSLAGRRKFDRNFRLATCSRLYQVGRPQALHLRSKVMEPDESLESLVPAHIRMLLEELSKKNDFVDCAQAIVSLRFKPEVARVLLVFLPDWISRGC